MRPMSCAYFMPPARAAVEADMKSVVEHSEELRRQFAGTLDRHGLHLINTFGLAALQAAYDHGEEWLEQVLSYIESNLDYLEEFYRQINEEGRAHVDVVCPHCQANFEWEAVPLGG